MHKNTECNNVCIPQETTIEAPKLAHGYVPIQYMCETFSPLGSLQRGTAFPSLCGLYDYRLKGVCPCDE